MIAHIVQWALRQRIASPTLKGALAALAECAGREGRVVITQTALAEKLDVTERQARRYLADLEALGIISRERRNKGNRGRAADCITLAIGRTFDVRRADLSAALAAPRKRKKVSGSEFAKRGSLPDILQPVAQPDKSVRANRTTSKGSAEPKNQRSFQGVTASDRRAQTGNVATRVDGVPLPPETSPHGTTFPRRWTGSIYARQWALTSGATRGTVH